MVRGERDESGDTVLAIQRIERRAGRREDPVRERRRQRGVGGHEGQVLATVSVPHGHDAVESDMAHRSPSISGRPGAKSSIDTNTPHV